MIKLIFALEVDEDGWPPVAAEGLWCEEEAGAYRVKNTPFFVKDIAFDDLVRVRQLDDSQVVLGQVLEASGNSTVWLYFRQLSESQEALTQLRALGCGFEGGAIEGYYALNVPKETSMAEVERVLAPIKESDGLFVAYPADRHPP